MTPAMGYTEMKDSGIEWVGMIPSHWTITTVRTSYIVTLGKMLKSDKTYDGDTLENYLCAANIKWGGVDTTVQKRMWFSSEEKAQYLLKRGDTLIMEGGLAGTACTYNDEFSPCYIQNSVHRCSSKSGNLPRFLYFWMYAVCAKGYVDSICNKATIQHYTKEKVLSTPIVIPPLPEQISIAAYLDTQCAKIDEIIAEAKASIEDYKKWKASIIYEAVTKGLDPTAEMKDSGIEWIGAIPKSWDIVRGKNIIALLERPVNSSDDVITCFRDGEVTLRKNRREEGFTNSLKEIGYQGVNPGDLVVHGMDGFAGSIGISDSRGKASPVLNVLDSNQNKRYLMYYLRGMAYKDIFMALSTGIRVRSCDLRWNKLSVFPFLLPSLSEQSAIAAYLDTQCAKIDELSTEKQSLISDLEAYKKSLIYEVVTGKRSVC